jgi:hypothetical protein
MMGVAVRLTFRRRLSLWARSYDRVDEMGGQLGRMKRGIPEQSWSEALRSLSQGGKHTAGDMETAVTPLSSLLELSEHNSTSPRHPYHRCISRRHEDIQLNAS